MCTCDSRGGKSTSKGTSDVDDVWTVVDPGVDVTAASNYGGC